MSTKPKLAEESLIPPSLPVISAEEPHWLGQSLTLDRTSRPPFCSRWVGGLWIRLSYALIDVFCVLVNDAFALLVYFSASDLLTLGPIKHFSNLFAMPGILHYGSFVLLSAALITLFCEQQDLYWTPRTRSSAQESAGVVKAVSYAA